jgi:Calcineurin-like phosphoesterase
LVDQLRSLRFLQIGDIHFPEDKDKSLVDFKDHGISKSFVERASPNSMSAVMREVVKLCSEDDALDGVLLCGDLTSNGDLDGYKECLKYLDRTIEIAGNSRWEKEQIHAVPGNHDIDRDLCDPDSEGTLKQFIPLSSAWDELQRPILATDTHREVKYSRDSCAANIYSLNSCFGCGERRCLPDIIANELYSLLRKELEGNTNPTNTFALTGEQLDTPAFDYNHISNISGLIKDLEQLTIPIVLSHHNILPQIIPRIQIYTEAINAGLVRSHLCELGRPVLYCHGHIHDNPTEIINSGKHGTGSLISISSPRFIDGFNIIQIEYGYKHMPIGCTVFQYRRQNNGNVEKDNSVRLPFWQVSDYQQYGDERFLLLLSNIDRDILRFPKLQKNMNMKKPTLSKLLLEAEWFGLIGIYDRESSCDFWQIERIVP